MSRLPKILSRGSLRANSDLSEALNITKAGPQIQRLKSSKHKLSDIVIPVVSGGNLPIRAQKTSEKKAIGGRLRNNKYLIAL